MSGFFGVASKTDCVLDLFFGVDYHSHLGTRRAGMAVHGDKGFSRAIHNIENTPFRTKFDKDLEKFDGNLGIGCISDNEAQPLLVKSHLGSFAITTVGRINNINELQELCFQRGTTHFLEMSTGEVNPTELIASLINHKDTIEEGLEYVQEKVDGSMSILLLTKNGIYCSRDKYGRTPIVIGEKRGAYCATFESSAFLNLGYRHYRDLGPGEIICMTPFSIQVKKKPNDKMKICSFLWVYYGYPTSTYEGVNVECMRNRCGELLAKRDMADDDFEIDSVAGVPDSGLAHAIGYSNVSDVPYARPFIKYTPTWPRSFMLTTQAKREEIAKMKLIPVQELIKGQRLLLIDDSIVRGTQLGETTEFFYHSGAREVNISPACQPIVFGCKYLNFSRSKSEMDLITRRVIRKLEGDNITDEILQEYVNPDSERYKKMCDEICHQLDFTSIKYTRIDDMVEAIGLEKCKLCTYCFDGSKDNE